MPEKQMSNVYRILQVTGIMNRGGAETMIMNLYRNINRGKIQFDFVENSLQEGAFDREILSLGGRVYHCIHWNGKNHLEYVRWWKQFFEEHAGEYPIVHGHIGSTAAIYLQIAKKSGAYTVAHSHSTSQSKDLKSLLYHIVSYRTRFVADHFLACSVAAGISRYGQKVVKSQNYDLLPNAIDTKTFHYNPVERKSIRDELGYSDDNIIIGHVGRFDKAKNQLFLLEIFKELSNRSSTMRLLLVGDGVLREAAMSRVHELELDDKVKFLGVRTDVNRLVQGMDAMVFPSIYEGLPVTLVEAQTSGLQCIISDRIPRDVILIDELVSIEGLEQTAEVWAESILKKLDYDPKRNECSAKIMAKGFDIHTTAKWLEDFYFEHI